MDATPDDSPAAAPQRPARSARSPGFAWRVLALRAALGAVLALGVAGAGFWWLWASTPDPRQVAERATAMPSRIVSADGRVLATIGEHVQQPVSLDQISPFVVQALLATEDRRFFEHGGIDLRRTAAALWHTVCGTRQGGSTLTQQLARNLFPQRIGNEASVLRKLREMVVALKIEHAYSKRQILLMYLNHVPYLYDVSGIEMAAQTYFGVSAAALDAHQAALLVAIVKGPAYYDPQRWPRRARERRNVVLALMAHHPVSAGRERVSLDLAAEQASALDLHVRRRDLQPTLAPHFVQQVRRELAAWAAPRHIDLSTAGLTVHTTLDSRLQTMAEQAVAREGDVLQKAAARMWTRHAGDSSFPELWRREPALLAELARQTPAYRDAVAAGKAPPVALRAGLADSDALQALKQAKTRLEAGFVALDPRSGAVLAYVGSRDYALDQYDHAGLAQRQPGSTFKAFVYGAALLDGMPENQEFIDEPLEYPQPDGSVWQPRDGSGSSGEPMTMRAGLTYSKNTITAQVMHEVGVHKVIRFAREMGVAHARLDPVPSLALGTSPVSLLEMVRAYATIASLGVRREPLMISHITDRDGQELARFDGQPQRVIDEKPAIVLVDMMRDAVDKGTGTMLRTRFGVRGDVAGKTGTTQNGADGWFIAMRPSVVAGAWVGFNDQRVTLRGAAFGQGGHNALRIVGDFMHSAGHAGIIATNEHFPSPPPPPILVLPQIDDALELVDEPPALPPLLTVAWQGDVRAPQAPQPSQTQTDTLVQRAPVPAPISAPISALIPAPIPAPVAPPAAAPAALPVAPPAASQVAQPAPPPDAQPLPPADALAESPPGGSRAEPRGAGIAGGAGAPLDTEPADTGATTKRRRQASSSFAAAPGPRSLRFASPAAPTVAVDAAWPSARRSSASASLPCSGYDASPALTASVCVRPATWNGSASDCASLLVTRSPSPVESIHASSTANASPPTDATTSLARSAERRRTAALRRSTLAASVPSASLTRSRPSTRSTISAIGAGSRSRSASRWLMCSRNCAWLGRPVERSVA